MSDQQRLEGGAGRPQRRGTRRRWAIGAGVAALAGTIGWSCWPPGRDPWPARAVVPMVGSFLGFSADGRWLRTDYGAGTREWDAAIGVEGRATPGQSVRRRFLSADGRRFVGWEGDHYTQSAAVVVGDEATGALVRRFPVPGEQGFELAFRDDDRRVEVFLMGPRSPAMVVVAWDLATGAESRRAVNGPGLGYTWPMAHSADGRTWAYLDLRTDAIQLWDAATDRPLGPPLRAPTTRRDPLARWWTRAAFTPDGRVLVVPHGDGRAEVWDLATARLVRLVPLHGGDRVARQILVAPDGRTMVSNGGPPAPQSSAAWFWDDLRYRLTGHHTWEAGLETVAADLATGRVLARTRRGGAIAFSPDGRTVVTSDPAGTYSFRPIPPLPAEVSR